MLSINYKDSRPIYEQVRDGLRQLILTGAITPGEKLPSVRELATGLAINPNTIQRAYRELEHMGLIVTVAGKGAFAAEDGGGRELRTQELLTALQQSAAELRALGTEASELHRVIDTLYSEEGKP